MMNVALIAAFCACLQHVAFARYNPGWSAGWTWKGSRDDGSSQVLHSSAVPSKLSDADLIAQLYSSGVSSVDHPTLDQRMKYRRTYEVTERPEDDYDAVTGFDSQFDGRDFQYQDNSIAQEVSLGDIESNAQSNLLQQTPFASSSSTFTAGSSGNIVHTEYSTKIIHDRKK